MFCWSGLIVAFLEGRPGLLPWLFCRCGAVYSSTSVGCVFFACGVWLCVGLRFACAVVVVPAGWYVVGAIVVFGRVWVVGLLVFLFVRPGPGGCCAVPTVLRSFGVGYCLLLLSGWLVFVACCFRVQCLFLGVFGVFCTFVFVVVWDLAAFGVFVCRVGAWVYGLGLAAVRALVFRGDC